MSSLSSFAAFEADARARGFTTVLERQWAPDVVLETHSHPFAVEAQMVQGELWLTVGDEVRHLQPGDRFELEVDEPHAERYGSAGATYWAARR
ncbi:MAG: AraC family ligand binding domain-containing protein [Pseudomonadota bacterium]